MEIGDRIEFVSHGAPDPCPLTPGEKGTVDFVSDVQHFHGHPPSRQIGVKWDSGRTLFLVVPPDSARVIASDR